MHAVALVALTAAAAGCALAPGSTLKLENTESGRVFELCVEPGQGFSIVYHHSIYDAPVTEEFLIENQRIVLVAVSSASGAVREYFGLNGAGERHGVRREFNPVYLRIAMGEPPRLTVGNRLFSLLDFGAPGDRIKLTAASHQAWSCSIRSAQVMPWE
jgi:hypothetical protein